MTVSESTTQYLDAVNAGFQECKKHYNNYFAGSNVNTFLLSKAKREQYITAISASNAPVKRLYDLIIDYYEGDGLLVKELDVKNLAGDRGYFAQWKIIYQRQYYFMKSEFPESLEEFIECEVDCRELVEILETEPFNLQDQEFLKAVRFQIIQIFRWLEELYVNEYPSYEQLLLGERHVRGLPTKVNYIQLDYGDKRHEVMRHVYNYLNGSNFDITYEDFKRHFLPPKAFRKITWRGGKALLALLFYGSNNNKTFGPVPRLKLVNNPTKVILEHFVDENGKDFSADVIISTSRKVKQQKSVRESETIIELLRKINDMKYYI